MRAFVDHIEIWLSLLGLVVIFAVSALFGGPDVWRIAALTAIAVGVVHGGIFWAVRRRQRRIRREAIAELRGMLMDQVNNQLQRILVHLSDPEAEDRAREIQATVADVADLLRNLDADSLTEWQTRYSNFRRTEAGLHEDAAG